LLNLEAVFTILIAVMVFGEHLSSVSALASVFLILGALLMSYEPGPARGDFLGVLAVLGAFLSWAIENNLSQRLSLRDPYAVVQTKTLGAAACTMALALATVNSFARPALLIGALTLGSLSYGVSLICVMQAFRYLGAAREAAWFSTAPFVDAVLSLVIFRTVPSPPDVIAASSMIAGVILLLRERHSHLHTHEVLEHDHLHSHDEHHQHSYNGPVHKLVRTCTDTIRSRAIIRMFPMTIIDTRTPSVVHRFQKGFQPRAGKMSS
jgi:drug/metabolite transporter (DMT)-like permease